MAQAAPATESNEARRTQMLQAAAALIVERGFGETRIVDVARRAGVSAALVVYYFGTRERLLIDALLHCEQALHHAVHTMLKQVGSVRERLELLTRWTCMPGALDEIPGAWGLWFDIWSLAFRNNTEVRQARRVQDGRYRALVAGVVCDGQRAGQVAEDVDAERFAQLFLALTDGLSVQVALEDPQFAPERAFQLAMDFAEQELSLS